MRNLTCAISKFKAWLWVFFVRILKEFCLIFLWIRHLKLHIYFKVLQLIMNPMNIVMIMRVCMNTETNMILFIDWSNWVSSLIFHYFNLHLHRTFISTPWIQLYRNRVETLKTTPQPVTDCCEERSLVNKTENALFLCFYFLVKKWNIQLTVSHYLRMEEWRR